MSVLHSDIQTAPSDQSEAIPAHNRAGQSFPRPDGCAGPYAPQGTVGLLLLTHVQVADHQIPQIPFPELAPHLPVCTHSQGCLIPSAESHTFFC